MTHRILIAGGGIGGLAAALACAQRGMDVTVIEAAEEFSEVGAGIQLGPNAMKVIAALGLHDAVMRVACLPQAIVAADAASGKPISRMLLGDAVMQKYGAVYVSLHRADLHSILCRAAQSAGVQLSLNQSLLNYEQTTQHICRQNGDFDKKYDALIGADGLWSKVREQMLRDGAPQATGHAAFRALIPSQAMPEALRTPHVRTWWARDVHVVSYPVRGGHVWNVVVLAELAQSQTSGWSLEAAHADVMRLFKRTEAQLESLLDAGGTQANGWQRWNLFDRKPLCVAQMAHGRVALLGDAAHPMLPYLAQGAAMALEDAWVLTKCLSATQNAPGALQNYANLRVARVAKVAKTAQRNGRIFHLSGGLAVARDAVLSLSGTSVVGMPWLYGHSVV